MDAIHTELPDLAPISWAVRAGNTVYTSQVPIRQDGTMELGDIHQQATVIFENLRRTVEAAGSTLGQVAQVVIYLTHMADRQIVNTIWESVFAPPWPNRAVIGVAALAIPGMRIELTATAMVEDTSP